MSHHPLRIAFFSDILKRAFDGATRTMFNIIDRKPEHVDFGFVCGQGYDPSIQPKLLASPNAYTLPINKNYKIALHMGMEWKLRKVLDQFNPDVIHIASPSPLGYFAIDYANKHDIPVISIYHTHFISYVDYYLRDVPFLIQTVTKGITHHYKKFYNQCDQILVPATSIKEELIDHGIHSDRMVIWQRGLDANLFNTQENTIDERIKQKHQKPYLIFASRLVWEKNLKTLINIYDENQGSGAPFDIVVAGDGVAYDELCKAMPQAHFTGKITQEELAAWFRQAHAFVFPSVSETFGNVIPEAMACGCPCIIANGGGTVTHIMHGINGYIVPPNDSRDYVDKALELLDIQHRTHMVTQAIVYGRSLNWEPIVQSYYQLAEQLAHHPALQRVP